MGRSLAIEHARVLFVLGIADRKNEILVAWDSADIFRRARSLATDDARIFCLRLGLVDGF